MRYPGYGGYDAPRVREKRQRRIADLLREKEQLADEERRAPRDHDALALWSLIDVMGGYARQREQRRREIEAELLLAHYGYQLGPPDGKGPDGHHNKLWTLDKTRYAGVISTFLYREQLPEASKWPRILYEWNNLQQHVACSRCQEPLLQETDSSLALTMMQNETRPVYRVVEGYLEPVIDRYDAAIRYVFRTIEGGPDSQPLDACPYCHQWLDKEHVTEIIIVTDRQKRRQRRGI